MGKLFDAFAPFAHSVSLWHGQRQKRYDTPMSKRNLRTATVLRRAEIAFFVGAAVSSSFAPAVLATVKATPVRICNRRIILTIASIRHLRTGEKVDWEVCKC